MQNSDKEAVVETLVGDAGVTTALIDVYLNDAKWAILRRLYPFGLPDNADVPPIYEMLQCKLAARYILKRGAEGEAIHIENGIHRDYDTVNDEDLLMEVTPYAKVV